MNTNTTSYTKSLKPVRNNKFWRSLRTSKNLRACRRCGLRSNGNNVAVLERSGSATLQNVLMERMTHMAHAQLPFVRRPSKCTLSTMFDTSKLIKEIEKKDCLWNMKSKNYLDKTARRNAWEDICRVFHNDWNTLTKTQKDERG